MISPDAVSVGGAAFKELPGIYVALARDPENPGYKAFVEAFAAKNGGTTNISDFATQAYDATNILAEALKKTGGKGGKELADALNGIDAYHGISVSKDTAISFAHGHDGFSGVTLNVFEYKDGALAPSDLVLG
jgi:ABC-type branched-subunit amino acid transport system substrate-binding protein